MESITQKRPLTRREFKMKYYKLAMIGTMIFIFSITVGMLGFHFIVKLNWVDSFLNSSMILGGMGQISELKTDAEKIFAGCYALFSGVTFLTSIAIFITPLLHRVLSRHHIDLDSKE
ncbi:MAG TPA: hypothetical protein PK294_07160 [Ignavibacteria bacterium]|nr:hypothetical protein [Ignavibacteria bacterium]HQY52512.1 hypothetical protein [Ignavibacteria bacterium]HRB00198.1 hypothetical protein [Ignavibacteria bacterium]